MGYLCDRDLRFLLLDGHPAPVERWRARCAHDRQRSIGLTSTGPPIGPATVRSDGRPHASDEFGQHHITHAPVTALAKPIEGLSRSALARFSCGRRSALPFHPELSRPKLGPTRASTMDAPGPWLRLRTVPKPADPAPSLAQGDPSEETLGHGGPGRCAMCAIAPLQV